MPAEEIVVPFSPTKHQLASELRSTLLTTSLQSLRAHGAYERYVARLEPTHKDAILTCVAGIWMPIDVGLAHYKACDAAVTQTQEQFAIGQEVGVRVQGTLLGIALRTAKGAGVTPWTGLSMCTKLYERLYVGGGVQLVKLGPKEARMDIVNNACAALAYWRNGFRGIVAAGAGLFATKAYVNELPKFGTPTGFTIRISWA